MLLCKLEGAGSGVVSVDPGIVEYDGGLRLSGTSLWFDAPRAVTLSFLSSASVFRHHQRLVTSSDTVRLLEKKFSNTEALASPLGRRFSVGELQLELLPAGTVVGSAQLKVVHRDSNLLYTGGVRFEPGWLSEPGQMSKADVLVLNCPYDDPEYRFPNRAKTAQSFIGWVRSVVEAGENPVVVASEFGMAQELCQLLDSVKVPLRVHRIIADWNRRVRACEIPLQPTPELRGPLIAGAAVVVPPRFVASERIRRLVPKPRVAFVSGDAAREDVVDQIGAEIGFCLSCYVDSRTLRSLVVESGASHVYLGPRHSAAFERALHRSGVGVTRFEGMGQRSQLDLFQSK